jgi:hypothetical protein
VTSSPGSSEIEHRLLDYYSMLNDIVVISRGIGWSLRDIKSMSVRERRHWSSVISVMVENARATAR